jgi:hypothetical protein
MTRRTAALCAALAALPTIAGAAEDDFDPCKTPDRDPRVVIALSRSGRACRATVLPARKRVCAGDTVRFSVVNACDVTSFRAVFIPDLDKVTADRCSAESVDARPGAVAEIKCRLKPDIRARVKYSIATGTPQNHRILVDPELDIRR